MTQRRIIIPNVIYFITTVIQEREPIFDAKTIPKFIQVLKNAKKIHPFKLFAFAVLPDHVHLLLQPKKTATISKIMLSIKRSTAFEIGLGPIWQPRFYDRIVRDENDFKSYTAYINFNHKKHRLPKTWRWTSRNPEFSDLLE